MKENFNILQGLKDLIFMCYALIRINITNGLPIKCEDIELMGAKFDSYNCPKCGNRVSYIYADGKEKMEFRMNAYCSNCGKKINWKLIDKICEVSKRYGIDLWEVESEGEIENAVFKNFK